MEFPRFTQGGICSSGAGGAPDVCAISRSECLARKIVSDPTSDSTGLTPTLKWVKGTPPTPCNYTLRIDRTQLFLFNHIQQIKPLPTYEPIHSLDLTQQPVPQDYW